MSYPQPPASDAVIGGENAYRLFTPLDSPGDIYEIDVGAQAIVVGPQSDISKIQITYYDDAIPRSFANTAIISPTRSFVTQVAARNETIYPLSGGKRGRILISPEDLFDQKYVPAGFGINDVLSLFVPNLDVLVYFADQPSIESRRSDGLYRFQNFASLNGGGGTSWNVIPYYGRKYAFVNMTNGMGGNVSIEIRGVEFTTNVGSGQESPILAVAAVAPAGNKTKVIRASVDGMFDALAIGLTPAAGTTVGPVYMQIDTSDDPL